MWSRYADAARPGRARETAGEHVSVRIALTAFLVTLTVAVAGTADIARASPEAGRPAGGLSEAGSPAVDAAVGGPPVAESSSVESSAGDPPEPGLAENGPVESDLAGSRLAGNGPTSSGLSGEAALDVTVGQLVEEHLTGTGVPGAAVSIVADGRVLLASGYGFADVEAGVAVDPDRSIFRIGSLSKLITATAAMRLVEEGKLRLDEDINTYLDAFQVPPTHATPVTLAHLMTHSAGFEEMATGTRARSLASMKSLEASLAERVPPRTYAPGEIAVYTNFALCLTGYLVERAAGMPFDRAVETRLLQPLGMTHTTSRQDLPDHLASHRVTGYEITDGRAHARPFDIHEPVPAGGFGSTARDMARFMLAHLDDGRYGDTRILEPASARAMRSPQFSNHPKAGAIGYGFWIKERNGLAVVGHTGRTRWFRAEMWLVPERRFGIFVAFNGTAARPTEIVDELIGDLAGQAPSPAAPPPAAAAADPPLRRLAGDYKAERFGRHGPLRIVNVLLGTRVALSDDGSALRWRGETLRPRSTDVFVDDSGSKTIAFPVLAQRDRRFMVASRAPVYPYFPVPWYENQDLQRGLLIAAALALAVSLVWWPLARRRRARLGTAAAPERVLVPALTAGLLSGAGVLIAVSTGIDLYYYGPSTLQKLAFLFPYAAALLLAASAIELGRSRRRLAAPAIAAQAVVPMLSAALLLWWLVHWNFMGWYW